MSSVLPFSGNIEEIFSDGRQRSLKVLQFLVYRFAGEEWRPLVIAIQAAKEQFKATRAPADPRDSAPQDCDCVKQYGDCAQQYREHDRHAPAPPQLKRNAGRRLCVDFGRIFLDVTAGAAAPNTGTPDQTWQPTARSLVSSPIRRDESLLAQPRLL